MRAYRIDLKHKGRTWTCAPLAYRRHPGETEGAFLRRVVRIFIRSTMAPAMGIKEQRNGPQQTLNL